MQLALLSVAVAMAATATASGVSIGKTAVQLKAECNLSKPHARIINRCDYDVHIWSVFKNVGCQDSEMVTLKKGEIYSENYQEPEGGETGVSIKVSKTEQCTGSNIVQLEYFLERRDSRKGYWGNYLDVSYVDCLGGDCPTKKEGFYLDSGNSVFRALKKSAAWCPILACHDADSCAKMAYILPDDVQTKTCDLDANMDFYMCGSEAPGDDADEPASSAPASSAPASSAPASSEKAEEPTPKASSTAEASSTKVDNYNIKAAAVVTPSAEVPDVKEPKVKTQIVYVTAYEYVNAKRSEHGHARAHARRHEAFRA